VAYEKTWQFLAPQGPIVAANPQVGTGEGIFWVMWNLKAFLLGEIGGATQGLWAVHQSCDGAGNFGTAGDGVDRWGAAPYVQPTSYKASYYGGAKAWMVLKRTFGAVTIYMVLSPATDNNSNATAVSFFGSAPTGGTANVAPTSAVTIGGVSAATGSPIMTYAANVTDGRKCYGALSTTGDFWFGATILGEVDQFVICHQPVGAKANDQWPIFAKNYPHSSGGTMYGPVGNSLYTNGSVESNIRMGRYYNGAAGYSVLVQPFYGFVATDAADVSLFDFPAWVITMNATPTASATAVHSRGRLADTGLCGGFIGGSAALSRPVNNGTTIRDNGNIVYVTMGQMILPYNALVS
jgi:hypothetical protein